MAALVLAEHDEGAISGATLAAVTAAGGLGTDVAARWKTIVVVLPYGAMLVDIGCWWLTKWEPAFAAGTPD